MAIHTSLCTVDKPFVLGVRVRPGGSSCSGGRGKCPTFDPVTQSVRPSISPCLSSNPVSRVTGHFASFPDACPRVRVRVQSYSLSACSDVTNQRIGLSAYRRYRRLRHKHSHNPLNFTSNTRVFPSRKAYAYCL